MSNAGSASGTRVWGWYLALTLVHLLANYVAMRTLALRSLNPSRASLLVSEYMSQVCEVCRVYEEGSLDVTEGYRSCCLYGERIVQPTNPPDEVRPTRIKNSTITTHASVGS